MKKIYKWLIVLVILVISTIIYFFISKKKVIIIGDSYIVNLQNFCKNSNNCISRNNFIFFGINGMTSEELLLSIIKNNIFRRIFYYDTVFILIGTNDIKKNIEVNRYIENIKKIIQLITAEKRWIKKKIYLINIPNIYLFPENKYFTQEQIKKINIYNLKLKEFFGIDKIIDIYQINIKPDNYQDDGIHFNKVGTNNLFNEILKKIE